MSLEERNLRLSLALDLLPDLNAGDSQVLANWLRGQPQTVEERSHFTVAVDARLTYLTYLIDGPKGDYFHLVTTFLEGVDAGESERAWLKQMVENLEPDQVGTWLSWSAAGVDGGWHLYGDFDLNSALSKLPAQSALSTFRKWQLSAAVDSGWQLRRSLGEPSAMVELDVDLKPLGDDPLPSLKNLFKSLQVQWIGASLVDLLGEEHEGPLDLQLVLTGKGLSRIGIIVPTPSRKLALLLGALTDDKAHENLARVEGVLGVDGPVQLVFSRAAGRWEVIYYYEL